MAGLDEFSVELRDTAKSLRLAGDADLARALAKHMRDAARPVLAEVRDTLPAYMPNRYAGVLAADLRLTVSARLAGRAGASVTLKAATRSGKERKLRRLDSGLLAHPLFGNRRKWFDQTASVHAGFFTTPAEQARPEIREEIRQAMDEVADDAARRH